MKNTHALIAYLLLISLLLSCLIACNGDPTGETTVEEGTTDNNPPAANTVSYTVSVTDYFGRAMAGINALIKKGATVVKTVALGADGSETFEMEKGTYTVIFEKEETPLQTQYWNYDFKYDESACTLSPDSPTLSVTLYQKSRGKEEVVFIDTEKTELASCITSGAYDVTLLKGKNYFSFRPSEAGVYEISYVSDASATVAYHGAPTWAYEVPQESAPAGKAYTLTVEKHFVQDSEMSTTPYVFSFDASQKARFTLVFKKVAEPPKNPLSEPWEPYLNPDPIPDFSLPEGTFITDFDIFDKDLSVVFNETDGYYHLNTADGPVILVRLSSASPYLESFFTICNTARLGTYHYDEEGNLVKKELFNDLIYQYTGKPDANGSLVAGSGHHDAKHGVYPLDRHLAYALQTVGESMGWWNPTHPQYRFFELDPDGTRFNKDTAWLFACCYAAKLY